MSLGEEQQKRLAEALVIALTDSGTTVFKAGRETVRERIAAILRGELEREGDLDREAQKLLELHLKGSPPGVDRHKLLQMIKKRLADERGLPS